MIPNKPSVSKTFLAHKNREAHTEELQDPPTLICICVPLMGGMCNCENPFFCFVIHVHHVKKRIRSDRYESNISISLYGKQYISAFVSFWQRHNSWAQTWEDKKSTEISHTSSAILTENRDVNSLLGAFLMIKDAIWHERHENCKKH